MHPFLAGWLKILGVSVAVVLGVIAIPFVFLVLLVRSTDNLCGNSVLFEVPSPIGNLKAVVFERDCGATAAFSTQVSILEAGGTLPNESGNIFVADTNHNQAPAGQNGGPEVNVTWVDPDALRIEYHPLARIVTAQPSFKRIRIEYIANPETR